nr:hypothetical protein [Achromobacter sp. DMS1]
MVCTSSTAAGRRAHVLARAVEQRLAHVLFELLHLHAYRTGRHVHDVGRRGETAFGDHGGQGLECFDFHQEN